MGLLFFTCLASWLWLEALERNAWSLWIGYAVAVALGLWMPHDHAVRGGVACSHLGGGVVALRARSRPAAARRGRLPAVRDFAPKLYALALPEFFRSAVSESSPHSQWTNPLWMLRESVRSLEVAFVAAPVVLCGGLLVAAGWLDILRRQARAGWAMVIPAVAGGAAMLAAGHNLWPRFFFFAMGFGLLIVVHGAVLLPRILFARWPDLTPASGWAGYALAGLIILASAATVPRCYALPKQDFTGARDYVSLQREPGDAVITIGLAEHAYREYYPPPMAGCTYPRGTGRPPAGPCQDVPGLYAAHRDRGLSTGPVAGGRGRL